MTVEEEVIGKEASLFGNFGIGTKFFGIHDGEVQTGLKAVIEEDGVEDFTGCGREAEAHVAKANKSEAVGQSSFDSTDAFDSLARIVCHSGISGSDGKDDGIEDEGIRWEAILFDDNVVHTLSDLKLMLSSAGHVLFIDRHSDNSSTALDSGRENGVDFFAATLHVNRVEQATAGITFHGSSKNCWLGRVNDERNFNRGTEAFDENLHLLLLIITLSNGDRDIERVSSILNLLASDVNHAVVIISED
jgi:hypothetical protein